MTSAAAAAPRAHAGRGRSGVRAIAGRVVLDLLALAGVACILLVVASLALGISVVMFATGSMSPTIPAGSAALVREVPATSIAVGDVVTVDRDAELPVTHRVTEILAVDGEVVTFAMQGDDNADPDPVPYEETTVRTVLWSAPGVAPVLAGLQHPFVLGGVAVGVAVLVTWAFWPREGSDPRPPRPLHAAR